MKDRGYKKRWHLLKEVSERLGGEKGDEFEETLDLFLKGRMVPSCVADAVKMDKKRRKKKKPLKKFIVADHFTTENREVKIHRIGDNFKLWFGGKTEKLTDVELPSRHHYDLKHDSLDKEILNDLGGADKAEITFAGIYKFMKLQPNGENGALLVDGFANIFYVKDADGVLRAVYVRWVGVGWFVEGCETDDWSRWGAGCRVFFNAA